jgi:hypothetical protein
MRDDMFKVIVERPRCVNSNAYKGDGRPFRNREDGPLVLGMKKGYNNRKWLNENLAPLKRFLEKQVNRPWDKIHGEIGAAIDARSTVKQHILQHLDNFVAVQTRWEVDGKGGRVMVWESSWSGRYVTLEDSRMELFVHPLTGILLRNRRYTSWDARRKKKRVNLEKEKETVRRRISDRVQLHCIDSVWYEVTLDVLPSARVVINKVNGVMTKRLVRDERWDVVRKAWVAMEAKQHVAEPGSNQDRYGCATLYAAKKRQLSSREIQTYRLTVIPTKAKGPKGPFAFVLWIPHNSRTRGLAHDQAWRKRSGERGLTMTKSEPFARGASYPSTLPRYCGGNAATSQNPRLAL